MENALVSVIMPAYNCQNFVKQAIDSVLQQTYTNFELLIADDCSTDGTKKIIDAYSDPRIKRFHNEVNLGYLKASNKLFKKCSGTFITFQDADDYSDTERLEKLVGFLLKNPTISVVGSNVNKVNEKNELIFKSSFALINNKIISNFENYKTVFTGSALMIRKKIIEEIGIYNEYFDRVGSEDIYWFSYIIEKNQVSNIEEALYYYRLNSNSVTSTHKNPKAYIGHDLIMKMYFRRKKIKIDFIATPDTWNKADIYVEFLTEIRKLKLASKLISGALILLILRHPLHAFGFFKEIKNLSLYRNKK